MNSSGSKRVQCKSQEPSYLNADISSEAWNANSWDGNSNELITICIFEFMRHIDSRWKNYVALKSFWNLSFQRLERLTGAAWISIIHIGNIASDTGREKKIDINFHLIFWTLTSFRSHMFSLMFDYYWYFDYFFFGFSLVRA